MNVAPGENVSTGWQSDANAEWDEIINDRGQKPPISGTGARDETDSPLLAHAKGVLLIFLNCRAGRGKAERRRGTKRAREERKGRNLIRI